MKKLPDSIIKAAFLRQEDLNGLEVHPNNEELETNNSKAYEIMNKLKYGEIVTIENAWAGELSAYFAVGYALGLADGMETGKVIGEVEGAATR